MAGALFLMSAACKSAQLKGGGSLQYGLEKASPPPHKLSPPDGCSDLHEALTFSTAPANPLEKPYGIGLCPPHTHQIVREQKTTPRCSI